MKSAISCAKHCGTEVAVEQSGAAVRRCGLTKFGDAFVTLVSVGAYGACPPSSLKYRPLVEAEATNVLLTTTFVQ